MADNTLRTFKLDQETWERFKSKATEDGSNASAALKTFIDAYLNDRIDLNLSPNLDRVDPGIESRLQSSIQSIQERLEGLETRLGKLNAV